MANAKRLTIDAAMKQHLASGGVFACSAVVLERSGSCVWVCVNDTVKTGIRLFANETAARKAIESAVNRVVR